MIIYGHISYIIIYIFIYVYIYLYIFLYDKLFYHIKHLQKKKSKTVVNWRKDELFEMLKILSVCTESLHQDWMFIVAIDSQYPYYPDENSYTPQKTARRHQN